MKLFGMKDPLEKLLDNLEQDRDGFIMKTILSVILKGMVLLLLLSILVTIIAMLPLVIILALLVTPLLYALIALENLKL